MSSGSPSLRGGGDVLSRRLLSLRADILARGETSYRVFVRPGKFVRCYSFREVVVALSVARKFGSSSCVVSSVSTLGGVSVVRSVTDWLLFPDCPPLPVPSKQKPRSVSSPRCERSESAERS